MSASSLVCAAAWTTWVFVVGRLVQGGASAALIAGGLGLLAQAFPADRRRARATATWGSMLGLGIALGPLVAASFAEAGGWRAFYVAVAVATGALGAAAWVLLPESRADRPRRVDLPGVLTLTGGVGALVASLTLGREGWLRPAVLGLAGFAVVVLAAFAVVEARSREPMVELGLLRRPGFLAASIGALVSGLSVIGLMSYLPAIAQQALHLSPVQGAAVFGIWAGTSFVAALLVPPWPPRRRLVWGLVLAAVGELAMLGAIEAGSWPRMVPGLLIAGVSSGVLNSTLAGQAVATVPGERAGMGSGANNTARYVGSSLGVAVLVAVVSAGRSPAEGADFALVVAAAIALAGAVVTALLPADRPAPARPSTEARPGVPAPTR
ncbi:MFS transporter [Saccharopolyspora erythraea]|nr:MFS transporter [Saccharopolyspora erythraea]